MHPVERIARFHLELECIHPYVDGNGRTGRLVANLDLMREGYPPIDIKYADRMAYYQAFDAFSQKGDASAMIQLMGGYVLERIEQYLSILGSGPQLVGACARLLLFSCALYVQDDFRHLCSRRTVVRAEPEKTRS